MPIRALSVTESTNTSQSIALCPPSENFDKNWFKDWLDNGGRDYLSIDPRSDEGQQSIAKFHDISQHWTTWLNQNRKGSTIATRIDGLLRLINIHSEKPRISLHFIEGKHRLKGFVNAELDARIDPRSAEIKVNTLDLNELVDRIVPHEKSKDGKPFHKHDHNVLMQSSRLFASSFSVKIHAVTNETAPAKEIGGACVEISRAISRGKRNSAHRKEFDIIAEKGRQIFHNMQEACLKHQPNFSSYDQKSFKQEGADDALRHFINNPFNMASETQFQDAYACPTDDNATGVMLKPPFIPSFDTQSQIKKKDSTIKRTPMSINEIYLYRTFYPPLLASHKGVEMSTLGDDATLNGHLWYGVEQLSLPTDQPQEYLLAKNRNEQDKLARFHIHLGLIPFSLATGPNQVLGAAKIIVDMANAMLIHVGEIDSENKRKQELHKMGEKWYDVWKAVQMDPHSFSEKITTLGKFE